MSSKKIFAISLFLFMMGINENIRANPTQTCFTSEGLDATYNSSNNLYDYVVPVDTIRVKARSQIYNIKDDSNEDNVEEVRLGRVIDVGTTKRATSDTSTPLTSGYMLLTIVNEKN